MARIWKISSTLVSCMGAPLLLLGAAACAPALDSGLTSVSLRFVDGSSQVVSTQAGSLSSTGSALTDGAGKVFALSDKYCYAIMVQADDSPTLNPYPNNTANNDSNKFPNDAQGQQCRSVFPVHMGLMTGLYKVGETAELKVPAGKGRKFLMLMVEAGKNGIPTSCAGTASYTFANATEGPDFTLNGTALPEDLDIKFLAYGKSDLAGGNNTVDMQLLNGSDGLECDGDGHDNDNSYVQTIPWVDDGGSLYFSYGVTPFVTVECPKNGSKIVLESSDLNTSVSQSCWTGNTFAPLVANKNYTLRIFDNAGLELSQMGKSFSVSSATNASMGGTFYPIQQAGQNTPFYYSSPSAQLHAVAMRSNGLIVKEGNGLWLHPATISNSQNYSVDYDSNHWAANYESTFGDPGTFVSGAILSGFLKSASDLFFATREATDSQTLAQFRLLGSNASKGQDIESPSGQPVTSVVGTDSPLGLINTSNLFTIYSDVSGKLAISPAISASALSALPAAADSIVLPRSVIGSDNLVPFYVRTGSDNAPLIVAPLAGTYVANDSDDRQKAEVRVYRCSGVRSANASGCFNPTTHLPISEARLVFSAAGYSVLTPYQAAPYKRVNNNVSETRVIVAYMTMDGGSNNLATASVSLKNITFSEEQSGLDVTHTAINMTTPSTTDGNNVELGTFYPPLHIAGGISNFRIHSITSFDGSVDFPPQVDQNSNEQLLLKVGSLESGNEIEMLYRSPDGGRNWFKVFEAPTHDTTIVDVIPAWLPFADDSATTASQGYSAGFMISVIRPPVSTGSNTMTFEIQGNSGF